MSEPKNVQELLSKLQRTLKVPKERYNSFSEFKYRNAEDIMEAVKKVLPEGATILVTDDVVHLGDRFYIKAEASLTYLTETIFTTALAREDAERKKMHPEQLTGCSSSYARKYALNGLFCLDDTKDTDSEAAPEPKKPGKINPIDKTGNKAIDDAFKTAMNAITGVFDKEALDKVAPYQRDVLEKINATQEQKDILNDQIDNKYLEFGDDDPFAF